METKTSKRNLLITAVACIILMAPGIFGLIQEHTFVDGAMGIDLFTPWGLYIVLFLFFEALTTGCLLFAAIGDYDRADRIKLGIVGVASALLCALSVHLDMGNIQNFWELFIAPNWASPVMLDVWFLFFSIVFGVLLVTALVLDKQGLEKVAKWGCVVFAILLVLGTAILFCTMPGSPGWESTSEMAVAMIQGVLAGVCCVFLLVGSVTEHDSKVLSKVAAVLLLMNALILFGELLLTFMKNSYSLNTYREIMFGTYAPFFWAQVIVGIVVPIVMFIKGASPKVASILALIGVVISKFLYLMRGTLYGMYGMISDSLNIPMLEPAGVNGLQMTTPYMPTWVEWTVSIAMVALFVLVVALLFNSKLVAGGSKKAAE